MEISRRSYLLASMAAVPGTQLARAAGTSLSAETATGKVRGFSVNGVAIFKGIPYGGPTEGSSRFLPPSKPAKWSGERDCTTNGPRCVQGPANLFRDPVIGEYFGGGRPDRIELSTQTDNENCLNLNVLTPSLRGKRPVMVYIHGGGFAQGSDVLTVFGDRHVRERDVVLVGINHRINVFGYTYLGGLSDKYAVGNPGQLDLIASLEWVRDNISNFGGDPANVTIFGESGGGGKISALMAMPAAKGLFHKAIIESGSQLSVGSADTANAKVKALLGKLGLSKPEELQNVPAAELFKAAAGPEAGGAGPVIDCANDHWILQGRDGPFHATEHEPLQPRHRRPAHRPHQGGSAGRESRTRDCTISAGLSQGQPERSVFPHRGRSRRAKPGHRSG
jgi:para-nitrobenzyl esterase